MEPLWYEKFDNTCHRVIHQILTEGKSNFLAVPTKNAATAIESVNDINLWLLPHGPHSKMLYVLPTEEAFTDHDLRFEF